MIRSVRGHALDPGGNPVAGASVLCQLSVKASVSPTGELLPPCAETLTDSSGYFFFELYANADLLPAGTSYVVTIEGDDESKTSFSIVVTNVAYQTGLTYLDIAVDNLVVALPATPGVYVTGPPGPPGPALRIASSGTVLPLEPEINLTAGASIVIGATDNPGSSRTDLNFALGPVAEAQVTNLVSDLAAKLGATAAAGGDLTGNYPNPTLANAGAGAAGPIGDGAHVPVVTVDAKGRVTALTSTSITGTAPGGAAGGDLAGTYPNPTLAAAGPGATGPLGDASHTPAVTIDAKGRVTGLSSVAIVLPESAIANLTSDLALKAPLASPTLTGTTTVVNLTASGTLSFPAGSIGVAALSGVIADANLPADIPFVDVANTFTQPNAFAAITATSVVSQIIDAGGAVFNVRTYGLLAGDGHDPTGAYDTAAMRAAATAAVAAKGILFIPPGTFLGAPDATTHNVIDLAGPIVIAGSGTIKIANGVGNFVSIVFAESVDMSGLVVSGPTFNGNNTGNTLTSGQIASLSAGSPRMAINVASGSVTGQGISVRACRFTDWDDVNIVSVNAVGISDVWVEDNRFDAIGSTLNHDHSSIYVDCIRPTVANNKLVAGGLGYPSARSGIEVHGPWQQVHHNVVNGYMYGGNICDGGSTIGQGSGSWDHNQAIGVGVGFNIFATNAVNTIGINGMDIVNNLVTLDQTTWAGITNRPARIAGIALATVTQPINGLRISRNTIILATFTLGLVLAEDDTSVGIYYGRPSGVADSRVFIDDNFIDGAIAAGIYHNPGTLVTGSVNRNTLRNVGQGLAGAYVANYNAAVFLGPTTYTQLVTNDNRIVDDQGTHSIHAIIDSTNITAATLCEARNNIFNIADATNFTPFVAASGAGKAFFVDHVVATFLAPSLPVLAGSRYVETSTGTVRLQTATPSGTTFASALTPTAAAFTSSGGTVVVPGGCTRASVLLIAGGGGGGAGGSAAATQLEAGGGGGGAGGDFEGIIPMVAGHTLTVNLGAGGAGGTGGLAGGNGGTGGANGSPSTLTDTTASQLLAEAFGGGLGANSPASSTLAAGGGLYGRSSTSTTSNTIPGAGGQSAVTPGGVIGHVVGGAGGGPASTTLGGGSGGVANGLLAFPVAGASGASATSAGVAGSSASRADASCGTTTGSATVTDAATVAGDVGKCVTGAGIPQGTTILSVSAGVSFVMSNTATATATVTATLFIPGAGGGGGGGGAAGTGAGGNGGTGGPGYAEIRFLL